MDGMGLWFWSRDMSHHGWLSSKWRRPWTCSWLLLVWAFCGIDDTCLNTAEMHAGLHLFSYLYAKLNHTHIILDRNTPITSHLVTNFCFHVLHYLHSSQVCISPQISFSILPPGHKCWLPSRVSLDPRRFAGWSYYRLAEHFSWWGHGAQAGMGFHDMARVDDG